MKLILVSHGGLCKGIYDSYQMIAGKNESIHSVSLTEDGIGTFADKFQTLLDGIVVEEEALVLTDIKGGTPYNTAFEYYLSHTDKVRVIAGMNLPMLLEVGLNLTGGSLGELYNIALEAGKAGIEGATVEVAQENDIEF